jgi:hypothetical protein
LSGPIAFKLEAGLLGNFPQGSFGVVTYFTGFGDHYLFVFFDPDEEFQILQP